jgi:hypothetical protein
MKITKKQLKRIIQEAIESADEYFWIPRKRHGGFYHPDDTGDLATSGDYIWDPVLGTLYYKPWGPRKWQKLSREINPRRSGGFHNIRTEEDATNRVLKHKKRKN